MQRLLSVDFLLRAGVAFAFIYPAVAAWIDPLSWVGYFPASLRDAFPGDDLILLHLFGITELALAFWILVGRTILIPATLASVYLIAIILANLALFDIVFRDVSILAMTLALALSEYQKNPENVPPPAP